MFNATPSVPCLCTQTVCMCSIILHQIPLSMLTQLVWLGNAEAERRWQRLPSFNASRQSQGRFLFMFSLQMCWACKLNARLRSEGKEDPAISGHSLDSVYLYSRCWLMQKQQMRQHCRRGGGEEAEPDMALWASKDGSASFIYTS